MHILRLEHHFDAAHRLEFHKGLCKNLHGHRWDVKILIRNNKLDKDGLVVDFGDIKKIINELDHSTILKDCNENRPLIECIKEMDLRLILLPFSPTAENIAKVIHSRIFHKYNVNTEVTVWESSEASIEYYNSEI